MSLFPRKSRIPSLAAVSAIVWRHPRRVVMGVVVLALIMPLFGGGGLQAVMLNAAGLAFAGWVFAPAAGPVGALLVAAAILHLARLARWRGAYNAREPLVLILHLGYLWLAASVLLMGLAALAPDLVTATTALHALSAGAVGTMTLAVMTRASLGHTGRAIASGSATNTIYLLVGLGAALRLAAPYLADWQLPVIAASAVVWSAAFALFVAAFGPILAKPGNGHL
jgi:uncharacterized protein involved in response to NO